MDEFQANNVMSVPRGSLVLVSGVTGMLGIHIAKEALKAGFAVRGTVRSSEKAAEVVRLLDSPRFEYCVVEDLLAEDAFKDAMKNVSVAFCCACITDLAGSIESVIHPNVRGVKGFLQTASDNESVQRVVLTSTIGAATSPRPGVHFHVDRHTWNDEIVDKVFSATPESQREMKEQWGYHVYIASKIEAEKAAWAFMREHQPSFVLNVTNPTLTLGNMLGSRGLTGGLIDGLFDGKIPDIPSVHMVDIADNAKVHLAAAIEPGLQNERIFICASPFTWYRVLELIQRILPDVELPPADPDQLWDVSTIDNLLGAKLLEKWWGQPGWKGLDRVIEETVEMSKRVRQGEFKRREK